MIDHKVFLDRAEYLKRPAPTSEEIDNALAQYDEAATAAAWRDRITISTWDGVSNINSATPAYILENNPWADKVYILLIDGKIVYLQTHEPYVEGHVAITTSSLAYVSSAHANNVASDLAKNEIIQAVLSDLNLLD